MISSDVSIFTSTVRFQPSFDHQGLNLTAAFFAPHNKHITRSLRSKMATGNHQTSAILKSVLRAKNVQRFDPQ